MCPWWWLASAILNQRMYRTKPSLLLVIHNHYTLLELCVRYKHRFKNTLSNYLFSSLRVSGAVGGTGKKRFLNYIVS